MNQNTNSIFNQNNNPSNLSNNAQSKDTVNQTNSDTNNTYNHQEQNIGTLKKDKQKSPLAMLILFGGLIVVIYFIPQITPYFSDLLNKIGIGDNSEIFESPNDKPTIPSTIPESDSEFTPTESAKFEINDQTIAVYEKLQFTAINKTKDDKHNYINYTISNTDEKKYSFTKNRLYLEFYNENTYLGRILINTTDLEPNTNVNLSSIINDNIYNSANKFEIVFKTEDTYPQTNITGKTMNCRLDNRIITYEFDQGKIVNIRDINIVNSNIPNYNELFVNNQKRINGLSMYDGITAVLIPEIDKFTTDITIDYKNSNNNLTSYDILYYPKDTSINIIQYEIESLGYTCN